MAFPSPAPRTSSLMVNLFDGTRQPLRPGTQTLIRLIDGNEKQISAEFHHAPNVFFQNLPFFDNLGDNHTVIVSGDRLEQAGFTPVKLSAGKVGSIDIMLLPKDAGFNFNAARWETLKSTHPDLSALFAHGAATDVGARNRYEDVMENRPAALAALLNIVTAMADIDLPVGNPLAYLKELIWDARMAQDRFFAWADVRLVDQVRRAADHGVFAPEHGASLFHPGATSSFKHVQFGEANVQITFHENDTKTVDGIDCIMVEPDLDYFKDPAAHALLEVVFHALTGTLTDPKQAYVLRWMAGRHAGVPEFDPPYTIA